MLKTLDEVLPKYINADAAVGAFNLALFPDTKVLIEAAEEMNAPVILQISPVVAEFMGYDYWGMIAGEMARRGGPASGPRQYGRAYLESPGCRFFFSYV